jgi:hypothetical protein
MDATTLEAAACAPSGEDFDVTISGSALESPLTIADATAGGGGFTWSSIPFGEYIIAEAVLPTGATTYSLSAKGASGGPETGYRVTLNAETPDLFVRIYNFKPE